MKHRQRFSTILVVIAAAQCLGPPSSPLAYEAGRSFYRPGLTSADAIPHLDALDQRLDSPNPGIRREGLELLYDLARGTVVYVYPPVSAWGMGMSRAELQAQSEEWALAERGGTRAKPPQGFRDWSAMMRELLDERFRPRSEEFLRAEGKEIPCRALAIGGALHWDTASYRQLALKHLGDPDRDWSQESARYFAGLGEPGIKIVLARLPAADSLSRRAIFQVFREAYSFESLSPSLAEIVADTLVAALADHDLDIATNASLALGWPGLNPEFTVPALLDCTWAQRLHTSSYCARALLAYSPLPSQYRASIEELLYHHDELVSRQAVRMLATYADAESVLVAALDHPYGYAREAALVALADRGLPYARLMPMILDGLGDRDVCEAAAGLCQRLGPAAQEALPVLEELAATFQEKVAGTLALRAIVAVSTDSTRSLAILQHYWKLADGHRRGELLRLFAKLGPAALPFLFEIEPLLANPDERLFSDCLDLIAAVGPSARDFAPQVANGLLSWKPALRAHTLRTLGALGPDICPARRSIESVARDPGASEKLREQAEGILASLNCD